VFRRRLSTDDIPEPHDAIDAAAKARAFDAEDAERVG